MGIAAMKIRVEAVTKDAKTEKLTIVKAVSSIMIQEKRLRRRILLKGLLIYDTHGPRWIDADQAIDSSKKRLNVDSPSFTPSSLAVNGQPSKSSGLSPKAAIAAPFKPKGIASGTVLPKTLV